MLMRVGVFRPFFFYGEPFLDLNRERVGTELKLYELSMNIVEKECGYKLYDLEYVPGSSTLRVFIMDPKTKTAVIEDCVKVDRGFTPYCETENWIPDDFVLEVSSPGMYRELKTKEHFDLAQGEFILLSLSTEQLEAADKEELKRFEALTSLRLRGKLLQFSDEKVTLEIGNEEIEVKFKNIKKVNMDPAFDGQGV